MEADSAPPALPLAVADVAYPPPAVAGAPLLELEGLLPSKASELTGNAQTARNELFALFGIWVGFSDKGQSKQAAEAQDMLLRDEARRLYLQELAKSGARVSYHPGYSAVVSWSGWTTQRRLSDGRSAARNAFVEILRKYVSSASSRVHQWPIPVRPCTNPASAPAGSAAHITPQAVRGADVMCKTVCSASSGVHQWRPPWTHPASAPANPVGQAAHITPRVVSEADAPSGWEDLGGGWGGALEADALEADALLEDLSFSEDLGGGASSSKTPKLSQQAHGSLLIAGYRNGHKFASPFATRRVKKGDIGLVVEQVSLSQRDAPFLRVDFGTNKGVVDFNSMCCEPAEDQRGGDATVPADAAVAPADAPVGAPTDTPIAPVNLSSIRDVDAFAKHAEQVAGIAIKSTALHRLYELFKLIHSTDAPVEYLRLDPNNARSNCVLGFKHLKVKQPEFYHKIHELVKSNVLWRGLNRSTGEELKSPRWVVYELLRQIGVAPVRHSRGPKEHDPGPKEFMYAGVWAFNEDAFVKQRHRLQVHSMPDLRHALNTHEI